ncbi:type II toxin-antitoxin system HicB family antitoxin [Capnocytophaga sp.]|uniref:type II toxin-antitoxin system HicB family antitoxin n=1 Tax=Capnocytophaga sp. TaxID=44737 RepID=UPI0026DB54B1|nr:type II toxin-antitoxin system HicB family antitoxin [Capnocytophaga sp.]MDO5106021.1 type II toxin-antitoxin system HicB family antitoxin [Capnocytophaga sp.]
MKEIEIFVEKHTDGTYWGTTQNFVGIVSSYGNTMEELQRNLEEAFAENIAIAKELGEDYADDYNDVSFIYKMDLSSFFALIPEVKISSIAKKAGLNESLVRQYKNGIAAASQEQTLKIQNAVHLLGKELLSARF